MAETPQQRAERYNNGRGLSGQSFSVLNGQVVRRNNGLHLGGQTDWQDPISGKTAGTYKQPPQRKPTTQNENPFGKNFAPFEMPDNAPIRAIPAIGQRTDAQRNAAPQNKNPFAPNFQPFYIPDNAPIRQVIGPRPGTDNSNNASEINARLKQQAAEKEAALKQTKGDYDHSSGSYTGQDFGLVPDSTVYSGRDDARTSPTGVPQKGTNMSRSFNDLLASTNTSGYRPFGSNQLPTTEGSPDSKVTPKTQQILAGIQAGKETDMGIEGYQAPASAQSSARAGVLGGIRGGARTDRKIQGTSTAADGVFAGIQGGQKTDQGIEGYKKPGSTSRLDAALNDKEGINSYMSKFSDGDRQRAANRAFLDTEGSMEGLRAKEAVNGVVYAEQGHYIQGADPKGPAQKITRDQARSISRGETSAQALLKSYTQGLTEAGKESPSERQDPATTARDSVKAGFAAGAKTDFELNNSQGAPQVGVGPTVDLNDIPKDLSGAAGKKYLEDLDAGRLFK